MTNERIYTAYSYAGEEEGRLTLAEARRQVEIWTEKGYTSYVGKDDDPSWEDTPEVSEAVQELSVETLVASFGGDREQGLVFAKKLLEALGCTIYGEGKVFTVYALTARQ